MEEEKNTKKVTLSTTEIIPNVNEDYDQDIGKEFRIEVEEVNYKEATAIEDVIALEKVEEKKQKSQSEEVKVLEVVSKEVSEEPNKELVEQEEKNDENIDVTNINDEAEEIIELEQKSDDNSTELVTNNADNKNEQPVDAELKSDKKIIKISLIIVVILGVIALILFLTRDKVEKSEPSIKIVGDETIVLKLGEPYLEPGYFAVDSEDGDLTDEVTIIGEVDSSKAGIYSLKYKVFDTDRNRAEVYRNVIIESEKTDFDFKLNGKEFVFITPNADYVEEGYEAKIGEENIASNVKTFGKVDRSKAGNYIIYYVLEKDEKVSVLKRYVIVYKGEEMDINADLITDLNNWLIDEVHYSNSIDLKNVSPSVLLYFGALNCRNDSGEVKHSEFVSCLKKILNLKDIKINATNKYEGNNGSVLYNKNSDSWSISLFNIPREKDNLFKVIVENNNIYLYELYAYNVSIASEEICDGSDTKVYYSGMDLKNVLGYESCLNTCDDFSCNRIISKNYKKVPYVHTFRVLNGKYYWVSSDILK